MWDELSNNTKLNILAGESTVEISLLGGDRGLRQMIQRGASLDECLAYINENW